jgi:hypothetical protein
MKTRLTLPRMFWTLVLLAVLAFAVVALTQPLWDW